MGKTMEKSTKNNFIQIALIALLAFGTFSCSDDKEEDVDIELSETELQTILETEAMAGLADSTLSEIFMGPATSGKSSKTSDCYSVEQSETGFTVTFNNCVLNDTDQANGTVTVSAAQGMDTGSFTATYTDFFVGAIKLNGTRTITIAGDENLGTLGLSALSDMTIEMEDGKVIDLEGTRTFALMIGESLSSIGFSITGNWNMTIGPDNYTVAITNALTGSGACESITEGVMNLSKNGVALIVDFGDGTCNTLATVTYPNGTTQEINLTD